jgi:flagellar biosynthesis protein FlhF
MARVRSELGAEALILSSRRVAGGVEVTAALEAVEAPVAPLPVAPPVADGGLAAAFAWHGVPGGLVRRLRGGPLVAALAAVLRFAPLPLAVGGPPLLLVGPPGAGKTLTVARLAARLVLAGVRPLVISTDGKRAGALEQLAAFTRLLDLELLAASTPAALSRALSRRQGGVPVLIDSPGSDPFAAVEAEQLAALAGAAAAVRVVVLPAGLDVAEATDLAGAYALGGARHLVCTRLDLARRVGSVLAAAASGLALAEAGISAAVADGLVPMTPELLADRLARVPVAALRSEMSPT